MSKYVHSTMFMPTLTIIEWGHTPPIAKIISVKNAGRAWVSMVLNLEK